MHAHIFIFLCRGIAPLIHNVALDGGEELTARPGRFTHGEKNPIARLDILEKRKISCPYRVSNSGPSTDYATLANRSHTHTQICVRSAA